MCQGSRAARSILPSTPPQPCSHSPSLFLSPPHSSIYEAIGRGAHSVVYKGRKKQTIQYYAIKSVAKSRKPRVLQEVRAMHALAHPAVLAFHAWYETSNHLWLVLEYCVGGDVLGSILNGFDARRVPRGGYGYYGYYGYTGRYGDRDGD